MNENLPCRTTVIDDLNTSSSTPAGAERSTRCCSTIRAASSSGSDVLSLSSMTRASSRNESRVTPGEPTRLNLLRMKAEKRPARDGTVHLARALCGNGQLIRCREWLTEIGDFWRPVRTEQGLAVRIGQIVNLRNGTAQRAGITAAA